jgi:hypothetical protein
MPQASGNGAPSDLPSQGFGQRPSAFDGYYGRTAPKDRFRRPPRAERRSGRLPDPPTIVTCRTGQTAPPGKSRRLCAFTWYAAGSWRIALSGPRPAARSATPLPPHSSVLSAPPTTQPASLASRRPPRNRRANSRRLTQPYQTAHRGRSEFPLADERRRTPRRPRPLEWTTTRSPGAHCSSSTWLSGKGCAVLPRRGALVMAMSYIGCDRDQVL